MLNMEADDNETDRAGQTEGWDTFIEYCDWIRNYSFELEAQGDISSVSTMCVELENLTNDLKKTFMRHSIHAA